MSIKDFAYYFKPVKIVRDLVHEYVNLTKFDIDIIDTIPFQRLKDIRQLTCQHVYPAARHTRFEHSLGVLELTREAIKYLNRNQRIIANPQDMSKRIINEHLEFNASLAALLHDVGHCPFSHMGETEFDSEEVREYLVDALIDRFVNEDEKELLAKGKESPDLGKVKYPDLFEKIDKENAENIGAIHEQLSCIIILNKYYDVLSQISIDSEEDPDCRVSVDFDIIIRSILGIEYDVSNTELYEENNTKNVIVRLINSSIFDMDKLDYIMRDSFFTGIGTPLIDTKRLFKNMFFDDKLSLAFTSKAVPALQNMIDARDRLYMYVYNHHASVLSDFMNTYILRRLSHNAAAFYDALGVESEQVEEYKDSGIISIILGLVPKAYLFSAAAIDKEQRSDSDWTSILNIIQAGIDRTEDGRKYVKETLQSELVAMLSKIISEDSEMAEESLDAEDLEQESGEDDDEAFICPIPEDEIEKLTEKIFHAHDLITQFKKRQFLKPWWKTVFEFTNFMSQYFRDDSIRKKACRFICSGGEFKLDAAEFRSQIAKHVIYITNKIPAKKYNIINPLREGEFFVVHRATHFFEPDTIEKLLIYLKNSEIIGPPTDVHFQTQGYYAKTLTNIIPQKDYSAIYSKEGFYVFSIQADQSINEHIKRKHYKSIEEIFVFVVTEFIRQGEQAFVQSFQPPSYLEENPQGTFNAKKEKEKAEQESMMRMLKLFMSSH